MNKLSILLVEDDPSLSFVIKDNLTQQGYNVTLAEDGEEAIQVFKNNAFSACILDIMLPKKDGFEVAGEIKKKCADFPIIFFNGKITARR